MSKSCILATKTYTFVLITLNFEINNPEGLTKTEARKIRKRQFAAQRKAAGLDCN